MIKRITILLAALALAAGSFCAGYQHCYLRVLREAEFYVDRNMIVMVLDGDYNETYLTGEWPGDYFLAR